MKALTKSFHSNKNRIVFYLFFADLNRSEKLIIEKSTVHLKSHFICKKLNHQKFKAQYDMPFKIKHH